MSGGAVRALRAPILLLFAVACGGGGAQPEGRPAEPTTAAPTATGPAEDCVETTEISAGEMFFDPICVIATADTELTVRNDGEVDHTVTMPGVVNEVLKPGDETTFTVPDDLPKNAESKFHCRFHGSMFGFVYVEKG